MKKHRLLLIAGWLLLMSLFFGGCSLAGSTKTYRYGDASECTELKFSKAVYTKNELKLYYEAEYMPEEVHVQCYDAALECICQDAEVKADKGVLHIYAENAGEISGICISDSADGYGNPLYKVRYLNSDQYAAVSILFVDDVGAEEFGDTDSYYTDAEKAAEQQKTDAKAQEIRRAFSEIEGTWISEDGLAELVFEYDEENERYVTHVYERSEAGAEAEETGTYYHETVSADQSDGLTEIALDMGNTSADLTFTLTDDGTRISGFLFFDTDFVKEE